MRRLFPIILTFCFWKAVAREGHPGLQRQWSRSTLIGSYHGFFLPNRMSPILMDKIVIQGNAIDGLKAFKRDSGRELWSFPVQGGLGGGAVLDGDRLYFGAGDGYFYCLSADDGRVLWKFLLNSESLATPLVRGSYIFHITGNNTLYSFDKTNGRSLWVKANSAKANMSIRGQTSPVFEDGLIYVGFSDGYFSAINALSGRELWTRQIGDDKKFNDVDASGVLSPFCILVSSFSNALYCMDKKSGEILWKHDYGGYNEIYLDGNRIYYSTVNGQIHILDLRSGKLLKKIEDLKGLPTKVVGFKDFIVYGQSQGPLVIRDKKDLREYDQFNSGLGSFSAPGVDEVKQEIYFISNSAVLYRLDFKEKMKNFFLWSSEGL